MKKILLLLLALVPLLGWAENEDKKDIRVQNRVEKKDAKLSRRDSICKVETQMPHTIHFGLTDIFYEHMMFHNDVHLILNTPSLAGQEVITEKTNYRYTMHWFVDYQYRINQWLSVGGLADIDGVLWDEKTYDGMNQVVKTKKNQNFWNLCLIPTIRFTWLNRKYVHLYSALGIGLNINGGSETNLKGQHTVCAEVVDIRPIGIEIGKGHWFGCLEWGGANSLINKNEVYLLNARCITIGAGVRL